MTPMMAKLICSNKDAIRQRDEDTTAFMDLFATKRATNVGESNPNHENCLKEHISKDDNDELQAIAEKIRELAIKLQTQKERLNIKASNEQLTDTLTIGLNHILEVISRNPMDEKKIISSSISSVAASSNKTIINDEWFNNFVTPKAGNLSTNNGKTTLHSNISRHHVATGKDKAPIIADGIYPNPYPMKSSKSLSMKSSMPKAIDESLANLREKVNKAKGAEVRADNDSITHKLHQRSFSMKSQRSISVSRVESFNSINGRVDKEEFSSRKVGPTPRSLSTGRTAQHGIPLMHRILRRDDPNDMLTKTLTSSSSDSIQEQPVLVSNHRENGTAEKDKTLHLIVNHHYQSKKLDGHEQSLQPLSNKTPRNNGSNKDDNALDRRVWNATKQIFRRSDTPTHRRSITPGKLTQKIRSISPFKSSVSSQMKYEKVTHPITIDPSMSNASTTSAYLVTKPTQRPMKYRPIRNDSEKGFEIFMPDKPRHEASSLGQQPIQKSIAESNSMNQTTNGRQLVIDGRNVGVVNNKNDRAAMIERLQERQREIKQRLRNDLVVQTDHKDEYDENYESSVMAKKKEMMIDSTRAAISHTTAKNDSKKTIAPTKMSIETKASTSTRNMEKKSMTLVGSNNNNKSRDLVSIQKSRSCSATLSSNESSSNKTRLRREIIRE